MDDMTNLYIPLVASPLSIVLHKYMEIIVGIVPKWSIVVMCMRN
jgi:hypothetical protein